MSDVAEIAARYGVPTMAELGVMESVVEPVAATEARLWIVAR